MVKRVLLVVMTVAGAGIVLTLLVKLMAPGPAEQRQVRLSDGRLFRIEAVTFGTNHVVGWSDGWLVPLRKVLPNPAVQFLTPTRGQSRQATDSPTLVVWVYARDASGKYVDCQGVRASFIDDQGDVYPANSYANGSFSKGFSREAYLFQVFPRRSAQLKLQLAPWRSDETSTLLIANPCRRTAVAAWTPETLPATRRVQGVEFRLESLVIQTNGGPQRTWEPLSLHWQPVFSLSAGGEPATNWTTPEWEAEDATGNRGQTLGLHEPMLKFIATTYPAARGRERRGPAVATAGGELADHATGISMEHQPRAARRLRHPHRAVPARRLHLQPGTAYQSAQSRGGQGLDGIERTGCARQMAKLGHLRHDQLHGVPAVARGQG